MKISKKCLDLIKKWESFRSQPYLCPAGVPTIGYGTTFYPDGKKVTMNDRPISEHKAIEILQSIVSKYERDVNRFVQSDLNQNQFDALVSFCYNVGSGNFKSSTLLKRVNTNPNDPNINYQFKRWKYAEGVYLRGLERRRDAERTLYFS